ncbi:twin-arginine translocation pathway signal [Trichoderma cornu-damae]|uniref:Twin-arginine translocation pathway signal n=1 Tax=Trichoderma cornu-damae TaxID=654480 RepID=A0A9P8QZ22_9HYPO|nr:twin-arginine translocation pathway signal [Trichoderma cornu-damae]
MPSFKAAAISLLAAAAAAAALPSTPKLTARQLEYHAVAKRQNAAAQALGLNDFDILQFALTLENLEESFYREGFAKFPPSDFAALGLGQEQIQDLQNIGFTESQHVILLQSSLAQSGIQPVQRCTYNFGFTDAAAMVQTAAVLENIGISAYLGAAPLLASPAILGVAGSILTIEARHQSSIRVFGGQKAVPQAFDAPLGPKAVFSLAAPFIQSCPAGSDLKLSAFPALKMANLGNATAVNSVLKLQSDASAGGKFCAFTSGGVTPGGTTFTPFTEADGCTIPEGVAGITYLSLSSASPLTGALTDDIVVAGPMAITVS